METLTHLPAQSRVWIYQADRAFTKEEAAEISTAIKNFVSQWLAHKAKVIGDGELLFDRFVVLAADEEKLQVSGCSIDSTVRFIKDLGAKYQVNFFDRFYTCYKANNEVMGCSFDELKNKAATGEITDETIVFNNLANSLDALNHHWQIPLATSWHKKLL